MKKIVLLSFITGSILLAAGYKIPETSVNAVALGAANVAHNESADAAYYNPANMVFMSNENHIEANVMYIGLEPVKYTPKTGNEINSEKETFIVPSLHYVSGKLGERARVGVSIAAPGGLSKRWNDAPAKTSAEEFTLEVIEVNPTAAFKVSESVGVAVGFRIVHTSGVVKSNGTVPVGGPVTSVISRDMSGNALDFGYNLALSYKPISALEIGLTYRSNVNLNVKGTAKLTSTPNMVMASGLYDGDASVSVPLPAAFNAAIAYTLPTNTTIEFVYEKTYWSAYKNLDFTYNGTIVDPVIIGAFDNPKAKNWKDTNAYRIGLTQELNTVTLMAGVVIDESPAPEETLGFELPDSNSLAVSLGGRYKINNQLDVGLAALYSMHENRVVKNASIDGEFSNANALLVSVGVGYKF